MASAILRGKTGALFGESPLVTGMEARGRAKAKRSPEDEFAFQCRQFGLPEPVRELVFAKQIGRRWRFDFAFHEHMVAVEIEGLVVRRLAGQLVVMGRHGSIAGFKEDAIKYASAAMLGWTVLRFEQSQVKDKTAIGYTQRVLAARGWKRGEGVPEPELELDTGRPFDDEIPF